MAAEDKMTPGEKSLLNALQVHLCAYHQLRRSWRDAYYAPGQARDDHEMYLDAQRVYGSSAEEVSSREVRGTAGAWLIAIKQLEHVVEVAKAEWALTRDVDELNTLLKELRGQDSELR